MVSHFLFPHLEGRAAKFTVHYEGDETDQSLVSAAALADAIKAVDGLATGAVLRLLPDGRRPQLLIHAGFRRGSFEIEYLLSALAEGLRFVRDVSEANGVVQLLFGCGISLPWLWRTLHGRKPLAPPTVDSGGLPPTNVPARTTPPRDGTVVPPELVRLLCPPILRPYARFLGPLAKRSCRRITVMSPSAADPLVLDSSDPPQLDALIEHVQAPTEVHDRQAERTVRILRLALEGDTSRWEVIEETSGRRIPVRVVDASWLHRMAAGKVHFRPGDRYRVSLEWKEHLFIDGRVEEVEHRIRTIRLAMPSGGS